MAKAKTEKAEVSKAQKFADFVKAEDMNISHTYLIKVKKDYQNVVPSSVLDAIRLGFLEAEIQMKIV